MKPKKTKRANLENKKSIFFQIGTILTLLLVLLAFEWNSSVSIDKLDNYTIDWGETEELPPITMPKAEIEEVKPPSFEFTITDDDDFIDELDVNLFDSEADQKTAIKIVEFEEKPEEVEEEPIYYNFQVYPKFMGKDDNAFRKYIIENINFPVQAQENGLSGKVQVQFVVDLDGSLSQVKILRGVHPSIDKEVLRVVKGSPKWEPAIQSGRYVRAMYGIIISFELQ